MFLRGQTARHQSGRRKGMPLPPIVEKIPPSHKDPFQVTLSMPVFTTSIRSLTALVATAIFALALLSACSPGATQNATPEAAISTTQPASPTTLIEPTAEEAPPSATPAPTAQPTPEVGITTASGVQYIELEKGKGPFPQEHDVVVLHYVGMLGDGAVFDSSYDRGEPIMYTMGEETAFADWNEAIRLMQIGGRARIIIPPEKLLDAEAKMPDEPFIYEVKLVAISSQDAYNDIKETDYAVTDSGLKYYDLEVGDGPEAESGELVSVHYTLWREAGEVVDSTLDRGQAFSFVLGAHQVIPGFEEGVAGMKVGGTRQLVVAPELAYGEEGYGLLIDPTENIVYEVMLVDVQPPLPPPPTAPAEFDESAYTVTDSGLKYYDIAPGEGSELQRGQMAVIHYNGWLMDGGLFDSSLEHGNPVQIPIGIGGAIPGLDEGISTMRIGGKRQLVIPPELAYGEEGVDGVIPPNATLIFEIELLDAR